MSNITEEDIRSNYPQISIQNVGQKSSPKVISPPEKRQPAKSPIRATTSIPKTPQGTKTVTMKTPQNIKTPQRVGNKTSAMATRGNTVVMQRTPPMIKSPGSTNKTPVATNKTPVSKASVAPKTSPMAKTLVTPKSHVSAKTVAMTQGPKAQACVLKSPAAVKTQVKGAQRQTPVKPPVVPKQQNPSVLKVPVKPCTATTAAAAATAAVKDDTPDQSTMTVLYHMPPANQQRTSSQLTIEKIEQKQRMAPLMLDPTNQVVLRQVISAPQVILKGANRVAPGESAVQSVVIGTSARSAPAIAPQMEIGTTSEPLQTLQVTQQVTLFRPEGTPLLYEEVKNLKKQIPLNKQSAMTNVVSSTTNSIPAAAPVQSQPEQKVVPPAAKFVQSPVRQSNRMTPQRAQQKPASLYQSTRNQVKKVSPKREMQQVSPLQPPPLPPPELQINYGNEEEVTTSEDMPPQVAEKSEMKLIVILPSGEEKMVNLPKDMSTTYTLQDLLKSIDVNLTDNVITAEISEPAETYQDMEGSEAQWENSGNAVEPGEILGMHGDLESGQIDSECPEQEMQPPGEETLKEADSVSSRKTKADSLTSDNPKKRKILRKRKADEPGGGKEIEELLDNPNEEDKTYLQCRTVRIGSYKVVPKDKVVITPHGLKVTVPVLNSNQTPSDQFVELKILIHDIIKVLIHFGRSLPVLFFYTRPIAAAKIRKALKMNNKEGVYYDSQSQDETHRRITFLPDKIDDDCKQTLKNVFNNGEVLAELTGKEANDILVKASPKEVQAFLSKKEQQQPPPFNGQNIQTIMVYPPPPEKGGIPINTEDYACLGEDQFLNDVIIDFYLKYVVEKTLSPEDRARTHVFSSFFYKRLTTKPPAKRKLQNPIESDPNATPAQKRHSRVKSWTKNVNLFTKDFIVIPINENSHWFLAIVCFPGLTGPVRFSDNTPLTFQGRKKKSDGKHTVTIGSTTITAVNSTMGVTVDDEGEDRDEADGEDENMDVPDEEEPVLNSSPEVKEEPEEEKMVTRSKLREPIKQPCILIFDSLAGASRSRVVATLRDYLRVEYESKHSEPRDFSGEVMKGTNVRCPQQTNYTDCGLYVLQYVEAFFQWPVTDYHIPIKQLQDWFKTDIVNRKRYEIQQLLHRLMQEQGIDIEVLALPVLNLRPEGTGGNLVEYSGTDEEEDEEEDDEEAMLGEEEEDMMDEDGDYNDEMGPENDEMEEGEIGHHEDEDPEDFMDHEDHEMDEEDYGLDEDDLDLPEEEEMEDKELEDTSLAPVGPIADLKNYRIPRLIKENTTDKG